MKLSRDFVGFIPVLRWNSTGITVAGVVNVFGNGSNQLNQPRDIRFLHPNIIYIADYGNHRIQKYELGNLSGVTVAGETNGLGGSLSNQLKNPSCIFIDSSNGIYVSDSGNNRVQYWSNGALTGFTMAGSSTGLSGNTNNTFNDPVGLARDDTTGTLYIADFGNNRVMSYLFNALSGTFAAGSSTFGIGVTQLWKPAGLYFDILSNSLVIANHNAQNIVRWILGKSSWTLVAGDANGASGTNATLFKNPQQMTFDPMGNMYVVDKSNHRVQLFISGSKEGITIAGVTNSAGSSATLLDTPYGIALDNQLNLYIADTYNHRIQKFLRY
ncbi:unnamed protein product [Adineta ricciae]|uniref:NHL repeat containing protein-like protein n=2 Tax=Adineta ricciae TaxID=249248 RepID=A0A815GRT2_ADIRI|nr:unnamed protein product [Adineta ricciae]